MKIDVENPKEVLEDILTRINNGEYVKVTRCENCRYSERDDIKGWYVCYGSFCTIHEGGFYCAAGDPKEKPDGKTS